AGVAVAVLDLDHQLAGGDLEQLDLAVLGGHAAAGGQQLAVGAERQRHDAVGAPGQPLPHHAGLRLPDDDFLEAPAGGEPDVRAEGERLDDGDVGGGQRLLVRPGQVRVGEGADVGAGAGVVDVDLVAAAGSHGAAVGADGDGPHRRHVRGQAGDDNLRPFALAGGRLGPLVDPQLDEG